MSPRVEPGEADEPHEPPESLPCISLRPSAANDLYLMLTGGAAVTRQTLEALQAEGERYAETEEGRRYRDLLGIGGPWNNELQARLLALAERTAKGDGGEALAALDLGLGALDRLRRDPTVRQLSEAVLGPDPRLVLLGLLSLRGGLEGRPSGATDGNATGRNAVGGSTETEPETPPEGMGAVEKEEEATEAKEVTDEIESLLR